MQRHTVQEIGWYGVIAILVAYGLVSFGLVPTTNIWYLLLNLFGATAIIIETRMKHDRQPMVLNTIWALIALWGVLRLFFH